MARPLLVTGASGSLGRALVAALGDGGAPVMAQFRDHPASVPGGAEPVRLDLEDAAAAAELIRSRAPRAVVHAAAATDVDWCERNPAEARRVNADATAALAAAAAEAGAHFLYVSTDLVFDGTAAPYGEEAAPAPLSAYGRTKLEAEEAALRAAPGALVLRVALLYGWGSPHKGTFFEFLLDRLERGEPVNLFTDQFRTPLLLEDAAAAVRSAVERRAAGRLHLGGPDRVSRFAFGEAVCRAFGRSPEPLRPGRMADHPFAGPRPADCSLEIARAREALGFAPRSLDEGLRRLRERRDAGAA